MKWNTHQDMENRAYSSILTTLFPEQTKTLPRILVWSVIFLIDLTLMALALQTGGLPQNYLLFLALLLGLFWLQGHIWGSLTKLFAKVKEERNAAV